MRRGLPGGYEIDDDPDRLISDGATLAYLAERHLGMRDAHDLYRRFGFRSDDPTSMDRKPGQMP